LTRSAAHRVAVQRWPKVRIILRADVLVIGTIDIRDFCFIQGC
jgi:hypothetical protein